MHILIVNDDGYKSEGIVRLAQALIKANHIVTVIAPTKCNSGMSHATTFNKPLQIDEHAEFDYKCYSITGTPADCVKVGLELFANNKPDLIVSGINTEPNIGTDVVYSGTANAALEGALNEISSIALSTNREIDEDYDYVAQFFINNLNLYLNLLHNQNFALNVNVNNKRIKNKDNIITELGNRRFCDIYVVDPYNIKGATYTLIGQPIPTKNKEDCDVVWFSKGYSTITPIMSNNTDYKALKVLKAKGSK